MIKLIHSITFIGEKRYGETPESELKEWSKDYGRDDVISISKNNDGSITVFYWRG